jgi:DNA-binding MarR family transcriptional regulator
MVEAPENVNDAVRADWVGETTPFERVRTVMKRTYEPQSAAEIADRASTTPTTARKHLHQLNESGFVDIESGGRDASAYRRSNESTVLEQAHNILDRVGTEELIVRITEMNDDLRAYRAEAGVESPEDAALQDIDIGRATLSDWQTTRRNLGFAKVALALSEAEITVQTTQSA